MPRARRDISRDVGQHDRLGRLGPRAVGCELDELGHQVGELADLELQRVDDLGALRVGKPVRSAATSSVPGVWLSGHRTVCNWRRPGTTKR